jgi:acyl carrier protein
MSTYLKASYDDMSNDAVLTDMVAESFVLIEMLMSLQDELGVIINQEDIQHVSTIGDLVKVFVEKGAAAQ